MQFNDIYAYYKTSENVVLLYYDGVGIRHEKDV